jgi:2-polyprenyl-3-methyl-5-hydroxy-6-metoxy-1,4-benzoquinol methylase
MELEKSSCANSSKVSYDSSKVEIENKDLSAHWNNAYHKEITTLGWYEAHPKPSLKLIKKCNLEKSAAILNVGVGATTLVDLLVTQGFSNLIVNDLSSVALDKLKNRLGNDGHNITWVVDDLTNPTQLNQLEKIDLWHDRAVLHFFNEEKDQTTYFNLIKQLVKRNGFVIIATFNLNGATKCSGLPVFRYNEQMIQDRLGAAFKLIEAFDYTYTMPSGNTRAYVYTLFQRN